ncbi:MAG: sugar phosphate nucleotidyltransferase [Patescibacteria group bacterium]
MSKEVPQQAVILAGGESSRFIPFQRDRHKSTFSIFGEPIIAQTIQSLETAGVKKIEIVKSPRDEAIERLIEMTQPRVAINFHTQEKPLGMADALLKPSEQLDDRFLLVNAQQINVNDHLGLLSKERGVVLFSQKTAEPQRYGILALDGNRVTRIVEKPKDVSGLSDQRILGIYILTRDFLNFMKTLKVSQYQFEEALDKYARENEVVAEETEYPTLSLKYAWDLFKIVHYRFSQFADSPEIRRGAHVGRGAVISGPVIVEEGAQIHEYAIVQGPCYIGKNTVVGSFCKVRKETVLEEGVELQNMVDVKHSIIGRNTHVHSGFIGDSIIGEDVRIGANFVTANRRLDRRTVRVDIKGEPVDTLSSFFGSLIGDRVKVGIHCGTNPGVIIPEDTVVMPGTIV